MCVSAALTQINTLTIIQLFGKKMAVVKSSPLAKKDSIQRILLLTSKLKILIQDGLECNFQALGREIIRGHLNWAHLESISKFGTVKNYLSATGQTRAEFLHATLARLKEIIREADTL